MTDAVRRSAHGAAARHVYRPVWLAYRLVRPDTRVAARAYFEGLRFREAAERWSDDRRQEWRLHQLRVAVRHAAATTPYYRERFAAVGFDARADFSFADFAKLPVLERADVHAAGRRMVSDAVPESQLREDATGGSTGTPTRLWKGPAERGWRESGFEFFMRRIGLPSGSRIAHLWGHHLDPTARTSLRDRVRDHLDNVRWFECLRLSPDVLRGYHAELQAWRPQGMIAYASALAALAESAAELDDAPQYPGRAFVTGAEKLLPHHREVVQRAFRRPVHERYGSRDGGLVGVQLDPLRTLDYTVDWANVLVEPDTSETVASLLVTKLHADGMPMLRYRIGDIARFPEQARVDAPALVLHEVLGREAQRLWLHDGRWVHGLSFPHMIKDFPVRDYQVAQAEDLSVEVRIVPDATFSDAHATAIVGLVQANLPGVPVTLRRVEQIPRTRANKWQPVTSAARAPHAAGATS